MDAYLAGGMAAALLSWAALPAFGTDVPFDAERWEINAETHRFEEHNGLPSLYLENGAAWLKGVDVENGVIEFDISITGKRGFSGVRWRAVDRQNSEVFYIRQHLSGEPDANQYTPAFNGLTGWQLYYGPRYAAPTQYRIGEWMRVRIEFKGDKAVIYVDGEEPALQVARLKRRPASGEIGIYTRLAPAHFANFSYRETKRLDLDGIAAAPFEMAPHTITSWQISEPFGEGVLDGKMALSETDLAALSWSPLGVEDAGVANIARLTGRTRDVNTVFAKAVLVSETVQIKPLRFGYSDRARIYLNGQMLFGGDASFTARDHKFLGTVGLFDAVSLPLKAGRNELVIAVSESFGGWGVMAALGDMEGVEVAPR